MVRRQAMMLVTLIAFGAIFALSLLITASVDAAPVVSNRALPRSDVNAQAHGDAMSGDAVTRLATPISCTLTTTTTQDVLSPNDSFTVTPLAQLASYSNLTLAVGNPGDIVTSEEDYFLLNPILGLQYSVSAAPSGTGNYNLGLIVYDGSGGIPPVAIITDTNAVNGSSAQVTFVASSTGPYYFVVSQLTGVCGGFYSLTPSEATLTPSPTTTPSPTNTPAPTNTTGPSQTPLPADQYEPNFNFDLATTIALGKEYDANFVPWSGADPNSRDDDWYRVWIKPGLLVTCETINLDPGVDTNLILYDNNANTIAGNDDRDRANGDFGSRVTYYSTYEGYLYMDIGQPFAPRPEEASDFGYTVICYIGSGPTFTPSPTHPTHTPAPTSTPTVPTATTVPSDTPPPTSTPPIIQVRSLPTATPIGEVTYLIPINLTVYYDSNDNRVPDPGEGIAGISARVVDVTTGAELQHAFTDEFGFASLTVTASNVVRLSVPYLSYTILVHPSGNSVALRIPPYNIPETIP